MFRFLLLRDQIALNDCREKSVVNSCCKGTCVLRQQIDIAESEMPEIPAELTDKSEIQFFITETGVSEQIILREARPALPEFLRRESAGHTGLPWTPPEMA